MTEPYFTSIPTEERFAVKYLISDMYNPYISYVEKYFPNAVSVVDSCHSMDYSYD
ncbi:MAG: transposase [Mediterraneibacter faecis]|uniref:transposase n=1 Tax=Mediterraneibacter faecis TaxID=592978 RepID=UPI00399155C7